MLFVTAVGLRTGTTYRHLFVSKKTLCRTVTIEDLTVYEPINYLVTVTPRSEQGSC